MSWLIVVWVIVVHVEGGVVDSVGCVGVSEMLLSVVRQGNGRGV